MKKCVINSATNIVADRVNLPDIWTGAEGEWQVPADHYLTDGDGSPGDTYDPNAETYSKPDAPTPTEEMVQAECERRLAGGFTYDFGDERGAHTIATTEKDMEGWREVTDIANARIATSDTTAITIATETGVAQVTPLEWMAVLKAAAAFRQPIWACSFALQAQDPIPADYADDGYWQEGE